MTAVWIFKTKVSSSNIFWNSINTLRHANFLANIEKNKNYCFLYSWGFPKELVPTQILAEYNLTNQPQETQQPQRFLKHFYKIKTNFHFLQSHNQLNLKWTFIMLIVICSSFNVQKHCLTFFCKFLWIYLIKMLFFNNHSFFFINVHFIKNFSVSWCPLIGHHEDDE